MKKIDDLRKAVKIETNIVALICLLIATIGYFARNVELSTFSSGGAAAAMIIMVIRSLQGE